MIQTKQNKNDYIELILENQGDVLVKHLSPKCKNMDLILRTQVKDWALRRCEYEASPVSQGYTVKAYLKNPNPWQWY